MKLTAIAAILILLLISDYHKVNRPEPPAVAQDSQVRNAELLKLEAQLKEIEQAADSIEVKVKGDKESSGSITITGERKEVLDQPPPPIDNANASNANTANANTTSGNIRATRFKRRKEKLLDIDLSKINVPDEYIAEKATAIMTNPAMCGSLPGVPISQIGVSKFYQTLADYIYDSGAYKITVFKNFVYDRSSIPRVFWAIIDKDSLGNVAPLLHDLIYEHGGVLPTNQISPFRKFSRKDTDDLFLELMTKCGVSKVRRELAYQAVRRFGWVAWNGN